MSTSTKRTVEALLDLTNRMMEALGEIQQFLIHLQEDHLNEQSDDEESDSISDSTTASESYSMNDSINNSTSYSFSDSIGDFEDNGSGESLSTTFLYGNRFEIWRDDESQSETTSTDSFLHISSSDLSDFSDF